MDKIVLFGELMLRLKPTSKNRLFQEPFFESVFGGSEANVAVSLSILKKNVEYITALPKNEIGQAAENSLKAFGVNVNAIKTDGRLGIYFLESGACQRPSKVIYDRDNSCFSIARPNEYDWKNIFIGAKWFHVSGVSPAVSENSYLCVKMAMEQAKVAGCTVSLDLNYRKKLWQYGKSVQEVMKELCNLADVLIANEEDIQSCLGIQLKPLETQKESYHNLCLKVNKAFPNIKKIAITLRQSYSADCNGWSGFLCSQNDFYESEHYDIKNIVERVGAGDSFAAALIYGLTEFANESNAEKKALDFAVAASCLKHSIFGDFNLATKDEIYALMNGNSNGRIQR